MPDTDSETAIRIVFVTCAPEHAQRLADALVFSGMVACVNILPQIVSTYQWQGEVAHDSESLLLLKTSASNISALVDKIRELHPYELPEVIAVPVTDGLPDYIEWVLSSSRPANRATRDIEET